MGNWNSCQRGCSDVQHLGHAKASFNLPLHCSPIFDLPAPMPTPLLNNAKRISIYPPRFRCMFNLPVSFRCNFMPLRKNEFQFTHHIAVRFSIYRSHVSIELLSIYQPHLIIIRVRTCQIETHFHVQRRSPTPHACVIISIYLFFNLALKKYDLQ